MKFIVLLLAVLLPLSAVAKPPRRASRRAVIAFVRGDLSLPASTLFKRVRWKPQEREWEVTISPPCAGRSIWYVNALATDYHAMCFW